MKSGGFPTRPCFLPGIIFPMSYYATNYDLGTRLALLIGDTITVATITSIRIFDAESATGPDIEYGLQTPAGNTMNLSQSRLDEVRYRDLYGQIIADIFTKYAPKDGPTTTEVAPSDPTKLPF